jgi:hypothetical protein
MLFYNLLQDVLSYVSKIAKLNLFVLFQAYVVSNGLHLSENIIQHGAPVSRHLAPFGRYAAPLTPAKWSFFFACCYARCLLMSVDLGQNLWAVRCILVPWSWNISQEF